jgi:hypothetical protein
MKIESWDEENVLCSSRSRLYHLPPAGLRTEFVECLTSLLCRAAEAHRISTGNLVNGFVVKVVKRIKAPQSGRIKVLNSSFREFSVGLNGLGGLAERWASAVQELTGIRNVACTTMLPLNQFLSQRHLLRPTRAWCPYCLEEWRSSGQSVYEPLLWCIAAVSVCPVHKVALMNHCPACKARPAWMDSYARCGFCTKCRRWLGRARQIQKSDLASELATARAVADLLRLAQSDEVTGAMNLGLLIDKTIAKGFAGVPAKFAAAVDRNKSTIWGWQKGKLKIPLPDLIDVCFRLNTTPADLIRGGDCAPLIKIRYSAQAGRRRRRRSATPFLYKKAIRRIQTHVVSSVPLSVSRVAQKMGIEKRVLYKFFPQECKRISSRYRELLATSRTKHKAMHRRA